jgi:hypothetical protein
LKFLKFSKVKITPLGFPAPHQAKGDCAYLSQSAAGRAKFLIVVDDERMRAAVRRLLRRHLSPESQRRFAIALFDRIGRSCPAEGFSRTYYE